MGTILKIWPVIRLILGGIFFISTLILSFSLIYLALSKKKLGIYINQIKKKGSIGGVNIIFLMLDPFLVFSVFDTYPEIKNNAVLNQNKVILDLQKLISILTKVLKIIIIIDFTSILLLIILINRLGVS